MVDPERSTLLQFVSIVLIEENFGIVLDEWVDKPWKA